MYETSACAQGSGYQKYSHTIKASMVAYFCHHLSDNYVDLSDILNDVSVIYVDLSEKKSSQLQASYLF